MSNPPSVAVSSLRPATKSHVFRLGVLPIPALGHPLQFQDGGRLLLSLCRGADSEGVGRPSCIFSTASAESQLRPPSLGPVPCV